MVVMDGIKMYGFSQCQDRLRECMKEISAERKRTNGKHPYYLVNDKELLERCWKAKNITVAEEKEIFHIHSRIPAKKGD